MIFDTCHFLFVNHDKRRTLESQRRCRSYLKASSHFKVSEGMMQTGLEKIWLRGCTINQSIVNQCDVGVALFPPVLSADFKVSKL